MKNLSLSVIAPSFKIPNQDLDLCLKALNKLKVQVQIENPLFKPNELCAHTESKRFKDLKLALSSKSDFIWCLRGGYGALHLLPSLMKLSKPKSQSKLIGFSDITILHYYLNQEWNWPSLHWKHLNGFLLDHKDFRSESFVNAVESLQNQKEFEFTNLKPLNAKSRKVRSLKSKIIGGNLITLQSMVGLKIKKPKSRLLFLEEIDEPVYKIDRALTQLELNGWFKNLDGILLGSFTHKNVDVQKDTESYLKEKFKAYSVPVFANLQAGHIPDQKPLFFNSASQILFDKNKFSLKIKNGFLS